MSSDPQASYLVSYTNQARKELSNLEKATARRIHSAVLNLAEDPRPTGCRKLKNRTDYWRIRIGSYRVLYSIDDHRVLVVVISVGHRREVYRDRD
ncbi:type II toxin-antitoxin system RelE/ParE family toxin [Streptomonospora sediminis]